MGILVPNYQSLNNLKGSLAQERLGFLFRLGYIPDNICGPHKFFKFGAYRVRSLKRILPQTLLGGTKSFHSDGRFS